MTTEDLGRVDARLLLRCRCCGKAFRRDPQRIGRPARICPGCKESRVEGDISEAEVDRRHAAALSQSRAAGRFRLGAADCWHDSSLARVVDRGPETELGEGAW